MGQYREIVVPLFFLAGALVLFGAVFLVLKRVRRRRAKSADGTREQATTS
ncbi:MAG: hypothetical protein Q8Q09_28420 [Deltaproteobacteria bacterium]|nr:hypothetical protein [Deltaproteobacteria bacterium]